MPARTATKARIAPPPRLAWITPLTPRAASSCAPMAKAFCRDGARGLEVDDGDEIRHDRSHGAVNFNNQVFVLKRNDRAGLLIGAFNFTSTENPSTSGVSRQRNDLALKNLAGSPIE